MTDNPREGEREEERMGTGEGYTPLYETKEAKGRLIYRIFAGTILVAICIVWIYRAITIQKAMVEYREEGKLLELWGLIAMFCAEIWFGFYWILTQSLRWRPIYRYTFKERLLMRYAKHKLPKVDIFVCTADPTIEPPIMVINTILSVMAYDYPSEKLSIYLSDDGGSILTFYALFEASFFSKTWLPYCRKYGIEPRSPAAYFALLPQPTSAAHSADLGSVKKLYEEMQQRIETSTKLNRISEEIRAQHKGFSQWGDSYTSKRDHDTIFQILIDGRNPEAKDIKGDQLPTLVYLAREKRPKHFHNYKAGAMNALIRVSSEISNGPIILNVDCDMYSNNSQSILDALCCFMDERRSHGIAFVQFPQKFENVTKNDIYGASLRVISEVEIPGLDGVGGPSYIGTGCFHRREALLGRKYTEDYKFDWTMQNDLVEVEGNVADLQERTKKLASCTYELNSQWGKQVGLKYGCALEDVMTGLAIKCRGWKSIYLNPKRKSFLGLAATTLADTLVQHKRWSEGDLQIMLNYCPLWYGRNNISLALQLGYSHYCLWALNSLATLSYCTIPSLHMLKGIPLFPKVSNTWFLPFGYIIIATGTYSLAEFLCSGGTILEWWNEQRMWLYKRTSSYLFALFDTILKLLGFSNMKFTITTKVMDEDVSRRYKKGVMDFGVPSPMFTILTCVAMVNIFAVVDVLKRLMLAEEGEKMRLLEILALQIFLCTTLVFINLPLYMAILIRKDKGRMPNSITMKATLIALLVCALFYPLGF